MAVVVDLMSFVLEVITSALAIALGMMVWRDGKRSDHFIGVCLLLLGAMLLWISASPALRLIEAAR